MADMRLLSFEPDPEIDQSENPGTGLFHFEDGSKFYFQDPELAETARQVRDERPLVAGPGGGEQYDAGDKRLLEEAGLGFQGETARQFSNVGQSLEAAQTPDLPVNQAPPQAEKPGQADRVLQTVGLNPADIAAQLNAPKYVPGVDPNRMREQGVPVPQTVSTEGGIPMEVYQHQAAARQRASNDLVEAQRQMVGLQASRAAHEAAQLQAELPELQRSAARQQSDLMAQQKAIEAERAALYDEINNFQPQVDTRRYFKNRGFFSEIMAVLGQGLGAYSATVGGGPNWAQQYIDKRINEDIESQELEIREGRVSQNNRLAQLATKYDDLNQAKVALRMQMQAIVDRERNAHALASGAEDAMAANQIWEAQRQEQRVADETEFFNAALGKKTVSEKFVQPSRGGYREPTLDEKLGTAKRLKDLGFGEGAEPEIDRKELREYGKKKEAVSMAKRAFLNYAEAIGAKFDPVTGKVTNPEQVLKRGIPGAGATGSGSMSVLPQEEFLTEEGRTVRRTAGRAVQETVRLISGAQATDQEREQIRRAMGVDSWRDEDVLRGLEEGWRTINEKDREIDATHGGAYVEQRQAQEREVGIIRSGGAEEAY